MIKKLLVALVILQLTACASYDKVLTASNGQQYHCRQEGFGLIGSMVAGSRHEDCLNNAKEKGYK